MVLLVVYHIQQSITQYMVSVLAIIPRLITLTNFLANSACSHSNSDPPPLLKKNGI